MKVLRKLSVFAAALLIGTACFAQEPADQKKVLVDRVDTTAFIQVEANSFRSLSPKQQQLGYWLYEASIAIDPIFYDQLSRYGLRQKRVLEGIAAHPQGTDPKAMDKILAFTKLFWANRGNHNDITSQKILPTFTFEELQQAAKTAMKNGAYRTPLGKMPPLATEAALNKELNDLKQSLFDPDFEPMITAKSPQGGRDILQSSSNNFYSNVSLADLKGFKEIYPLNSRLVNVGGGKLVEEVYRAGTPDGKIKPGMYAEFLKRTNGYLEKAAAVADPQQAQVIRDLIRYYQTGDFKDWLKFGADWVQNNANVDFVNGFVEVYRDARGAKGSSQSFVSITDKKVSDAMSKLAQNAEYFEEKAPWDVKYKKQAFKLPVVKAVETLIESGDFNVTTVGDNLPNENEIHEKYGTKNFLFTGSSRALAEASGYSALEEFSLTPEEVEIGKKYGIEASDLFTAMHEVIGHGSGKLSPRITKGAEPYLKEYFSTLEEGRADLMALWNAWDPKLKELGLITDQDNVAKAMYNSAARAPLVQLRSIPKGDTVEEDHQRDRQLIVNYIIDKTGAIEKVERGGKMYFHVKDYQEMRRGVGLLLAELMRIKAEGDYEAIKALVDKYGVHFDPTLRDQVIARYKKLNLPTYWAGINSELKASKAGTVELSYPRDVVRQYLNYGAMYDPTLSPGARQPQAKAATETKVKR
ncbi:MAG: putative dipeptidyl-peptidase [Candidatus Angelobacter sp.]|nr:putative dipeptidyl-peptidase [Candidatus Angelobacter sp.]